jgi:Leucine-rich repeat (LRR) protein
MKILLILFFLSSTSAIIFDCDFSEADFTHFSSIYICSVFNYTDESNQALTQVRGNTESSKTYADVKGIYLNLEGKNLTFIPKGLENFFPNLSGIFIYHGNITNLNGDELKEYKNLEWFAIEFNPIKKVPRNLFANKSRLKTIFLDNNEITQIEAGMFDGLNNLEKVYLSHNLCINIDAESPSDIEKLKSSLMQSCANVEATTGSSPILRFETLTESSSDIIFQTGKAFDLSVSETSRIERKFPTCDDLVLEKLEKLSQENQEIKKMLRAILNKLN